MGKRLKKRYHPKNRALMNKHWRATGWSECLVPARMEVFAVTIFMSLCFAVLFAALFFAERCQRPGRSIEQMSLLPLESDNPTAVEPETLSKTNS